MKSSVLFWNDKEWYYMTYFNENFNEFAGICRVSIRIEKTDWTTVISYTTSPTNPVNVFINVRWQIKVNDVINAFDICQTIYYNKRKLYWERRSQYPVHERQRWSLPECFWLQF